MPSVISQPTLGGVTLPYPSGISIDRAEVSAEQTTMKATTNKDVMGYKYIYTLEYSYMSVAYFNNLLTVIDTLLPATFIYDKFPQSANAGVSVIPSIGKRTVKHTTSGTGDTAYYSGVTLLLKEVSGRI